MRAKLSSLLPPATSCAGRFTLPPRPRPPDPNARTSPRPWPSWSQADGSAVPTRYPDRDTENGGTKLLPAEVAVLNMDGNMLNQLTISELTRKLAKREVSARAAQSEEHTSELQSRFGISYAV